ncbi:MAG: hypothetical protein KAT15_05075 [Bacteroidales bacterium]|nr:hypothetical protein [Bacteroidales bacterium]
MTDPRRMIRNMGFLKDQEGIMNRYLRERSHWEEHLERTRAFINGAFRDGSIGSVAVLGSGWLLDVPLDSMVERYKQIYLVDIIHPPQIRRKVKDMANVEIIETDLSGGVIEQLWPIIRSKNRETGHQALDSITLSPPLDHLSPDAFVSVNLLNQLDIILCDYLRKQGYFQQGSSNQFRSRLQAFHLEWITAKPGCLITDTIEVSSDNEGKESHKSLLHTDLPPGIRSEQWGWEFDTTGSYRSGTRTHMEVQAIEWA